MANNRYVNTNFWKDNYVADLDPTEKLVFIYLLTNPRTNMAGAYEINVREVAFDTGIDKDMIVKIMQRFENDNKILVESGWVVLLNFQKHQNLNPKTLVTVSRLFATMPAQVISKLARSSTFLAHSSKWLSLQQKEDGTYDYDSSTEMPKELILSAIDSLSHKNRNIIETKEEVLTNVSTLAGSLEDEIIKAERRLPSAEINDMFAHWELTIGYKIEGRQKQNRYACSNLLKKHGREGVIKLINGVREAKQDQFAPRISDFSQLQSKYNDLISWGQTRMVKQTGLEIIV